MGKPNDEPDNEYHEVEHINKLASEMTLEEAENNLLQVVDDIYFEWLPLPKDFLEKYRDRHEKIEGMYQQKLQEEKQLKKIQDEIHRHELKKKLHEEILEMADKRKKQL